MMLLAMIELEKRMNPKECRLISTVHDSILFEVREGLEDKYIPLIKEVMEDTERLEQDFECLLTVPIVADVKYGTHWSEGAIEVS